MSPVCVPCPVYIELHTASAFSFLQGASLPEALVDRAADLGYSGAGAARSRRRLRRAALSQGGARRRHPADHRRGTDDWREGRRGRRAGQGADSLDPPAPAYQPFLLPVLCESAEGYRNLCRLITRMKLRAPKGEGALTLDELDGATARARRAGRPRGARRAALRRRRAARSPRRHLRPRSHCTSSCSGISAATRKPTTQRCRAGRGVPRAGRRHQRRPLRDAGRAAAVRRPHLHPPPHRRWRRPGRRLAPNAERYLKPPRRDGGAVRRSARRGRARRASSPIGCSSRWPISATAFPTIRCRPARRRRRSSASSPRSARAIATGRITTAPARRSRASSISSRSSISPATS